MEALTQAVEEFLSAFAVDLWDLRAFVPKKLPEGDPRIGMRAHFMQKQGISTAQVLSHVPKMFELNEIGYGIYIRPMCHGDQCYIMIDDVDEDHVDIAYANYPTLVQETSEANYQVIIHMHIGSLYMRDQLCEAFRKKMNGDKGATGWKMVWRMPYFENTKPHRNRFPVKVHRLDPNARNYKSYREIVGSSYRPPEWPGTAIEAEN